MRTIRQNLLVPRASTPCMATHRLPVGPKNTLSIAVTEKQPQKMGGFSFLKVMVIIAVVGFLFSTGNRTLPQLYECYLLRDLADRVVHKYANMPMEEVQRRVQYELHRSRIVIPEDNFHILPVSHGYRVTVSYTIPLEFQIGEKTFSLEGYEQWEYVYETETLIKV